MSSSDNLPSWDKFAERDAPEEFDLLSPSAEAAALMQLLRAELQSARQDAEEAMESAARPMAELAVFVSQLGGALDRYKDEIPPKAHRHLRVMKDQMMEVLNKAEISICSPLDRPFEEIADSVAVVGWRHHESFSAQLVAEVLEPIITRGEKLLRAGKVIMGAPAASTVAEEPENTES